MCDELKKKKKVFCSTSQEWFQIIRFPSLQLIPDIQCQEILLTQEQSKVCWGFTIEKKMKEGF